MKRVIKMTVHIFDASCNNIILDIVEIHWKSPMIFNHNIILRMRHRNQSERSISLSDAHNKRNIEPGFAKSKCIWKYYVGIFVYHLICICLLFILTEVFDDPHDFESLCSTFTHVTSIWLVA